MDEQSHPNGLRSDGAGEPISDDGVDHDRVDHDDSLDGHAVDLADGIDDDRLDDHQADHGRWQRPEAVGYEPTGRPDVDQILERLEELEGTSPTDHVDVYEEAHRRLHETLLAAGEGREDPSAAL